MSNSTIDARRVAAISCGVGFATQIYAVRAENAEIWDADDKRYIDFGAGVAVVNTGHRHPKVVAAVKAQLDWADSILPDLRARLSAETLSSHRET